MAIDNRENGLLSQSRARTEVDELLKWAESLENDCQLSNGRINLWMIIYASAILTLILATILIVKLEATTSDKVFFSSAFITYYIFFLYLFGSRRRILIDKQNRDRRALNEMVGLLREVEPSLNLTALERGELRIRLSRFDIGPEYRRPPFSVKELNP